MLQSTQSTCIFIKIIPDMTSYKKVKIFILEVRKHRRINETFVCVSFSPWRLILCFRSSNFLKIVLLSKLY